jgi:putative transposase
LFGISRQAYYKRVHAEIGRAARNSVAQAMVQQVRLAQPKIGTRKLYYLLKQPLAQAGLKMGRDALFEALRRAHMLVHPKRCYRKTTDSKHWLYKHPNLLKDRPKPVMAEQVWVADITYIETQQTIGYLSLITDAIACPMTDGYDCYQNALAERVNGILKTELLTAIPLDLSQAATMIEQAVNIYNHQRPHQALKYKTPDAVHRASVAPELRVTKKAVTRQPI